MPVRLVACVPNISEGRRPEVVAAAAAAVRATPGVFLLDCSSDASHNRSVLTFAGPPDAVLEAAVALAGRAVALIDLETHRGEHPRIGALDVLPFVPLAGVAMEECKDLARRAGALLWERLGVPVYLYGEAAALPGRRRLPAVRRGGYEALKQEIGRPERWPDIGEPRLHPTAGATAVGARRPLIAFNIYLNTADREVAREIARGVRESGGGLPAVQARGMYIRERGQAQVSLNLLDHTRTSPLAALRAVEGEAARRGVAVTETELVGLMPLDAVLGVARDALRLPRLAPAGILETRLLEAAGIDIVSATSAGRRDPAR
ncbi:MAG: glutamate formimidoyltransferase [Armatimonadetes bacterium]|nr:glutamate formimidoyltransferase [Armatimonadota bacterium]